MCAHCGAIDREVTNEVNGTVVCTACGVVKEDRAIDYTQEWRDFNTETGGGGASMNRVGGPVNTMLDTGGIGAVIGGKGNSSLQKSSTRMMSSGKEKTLKDGFRLIDQFC